MRTTSFRTMRLALGRELLAQRIRQLEIAVEQNRAKREHLEKMWKHNAGSTDFVNEVKSVQEQQRRERKEMHRNWRLLEASVKSAESIIDRQSLIFKAIRKDRFFCEMRQRAAREDNHTTAGGSMRLEVDPTGKLIQQPLANLTVFDELIARSTRLEGLLKRLPLPPNGLPDRSLGTETYFGTILDLDHHRRVGRIVVLQKRDLSSPRTSADKPKTTVHEKEHDVVAHALDDLLGAIVLFSYDDIIVKSVEQTQDSNVSVAQFDVGSPVTFRIWQARRRAAMGRIQFVTHAKMVSILPPESKSDYNSKEITHSYHRGRRRQGKHQSWLRHKRSEVTSRPHCFSV